jgi:hypothetical protein
MTVATDTAGVDRKTGVFGLLIEIKLYYGCVKLILGRVVIAGGTETIHAIAMAFQLALDFAGIDHRLGQIIRDGKAA